MMRSLCGNGNGRNNTASTTEKMAVEAPIPSASTSRAAMVKPGVARNDRSARRTSMPRPSSGERCRSPAAALMRLERHTPAAMTTAVETAHHP